MTVEERGRFTDAISRFIMAQSEGIDAFDAVIIEMAKRISASALLDVIMFRERTGAAVQPEQLIRNFNQRVERDVMMSLERMRSDRTMQ